MRYAVKVIFEDGREEFLRGGVDHGPVARFSSLTRAKRMAEFIQMGLDEGERAFAVLYGKPSIDDGHFDA